MEDPSVRSQPVCRREIVGLVAAVALSILVHGIFVMDGFGEPDAARLAVQAAGWHHMGRIPILSYTVRVSTLYLYVMKAVLDLGLPFHSLANLLNWSNVILGGATLIPLYLLWRHLTSPEAAAIGCLLYWFTPAFWQANTYGMPHLPSFSFFVGSLLLFALCLRRSGWCFAALAAGSAILAAVALGLKADVILCCGAFIGVTFCLRALNLRSGILSLLIPVFALAVVMAYSKLVAPGLGNTGEFVTTWSRRFPFTSHALQNRSNILVPAAALGGCLLSLVILSVIYCFVCRRNLRILFLALLWGVPPILFWGLKMGNSVRHLMASCSVLIFLAAVVFVSIIKNMRWALPIIAVLLLLNYFTSPEERLRFQSGGGLIKSRNDRQHMVDEIQKAGKTFVTLPDRRKLYIGGWSIPHVVWEVLEDAAEFDIEWGSKKGAWAENIEIRSRRKDNSVHTIRVREVWGKPVRITQPEGWRLWTCESRISIDERPK
jgi:hypothetical protein